MAILDEKYVFHIPLSKYENGRLIELEIDDILDELLSEFESFNITRIESHYKSRSYDELLITVFTSKKITWNHIHGLVFEKQWGIVPGSYAYEYNGKTLYWKYEVNN